MAKNGTSHNSPISGQLGVIKYILVTTAISFLTESYGLFRVNRNLLRRKKSGKAKALPALPLPMALQLN